MFVVDCVHMPGDVVQALREDMTGVDGILARFLTGSSEAPFHKRHEVGRCWGGSGRQRVTRRGYDICDCRHHDAIVSGKGKLELGRFVVRSIIGSNMIWLSIVGWRCNVVGSRSEEGGWTLVVLC